MTRGKVNTRTNFSGFNAPFGESTEKPSFVGYQKQKANPTGSRQLESLTRTYTLYPGLSSRWAWLGPQDEDHRLGLAWLVYEAYAGYSRRSVGIVDRRLRP